MADVIAVTRKLNRRQSHSNARRIIGNLRRFHPVHSWGSTDASMCARDVQRELLRQGASPRSDLVAETATALQRLAV
jgi:hypothetical protein